LVEIRQAIPGDVPVLVRLGADLHAESPRYASTAYSPDKVAGLAQAIIDGRVPDAVIFVAVEYGEVIGIFAGTVFEHWFSHDRMATDYTFYLRPESRGQGKTAVRLVKAFEQWARDRGVTSLVFGTSTEIAERRTVALYHHLGYRDYSTAVIKQLPGAHIAESGP
jgi:GNAT superfamily N-acetyltransferase